MSFFLPTLLVLFKVIDEVSEPECFFFVAFKSFWFIFNLEKSSKLEAMSIKTKAEFSFLNGMLDWLLE